MLLSSLVPVALAALGWAAPRASAVAVPRAASGSLAVVGDAAPFTFEYATAEPDATNWIGIYSAYGGSPDKEEFVAPSLTWEYAPASSGSVQLAASKLQPGPYRAFFLAKDGYKWLANPVDVFVPGTGPVSFLVPSFETANARVGDAFSARVGGLLASAPDANTRFAKTAGDDWVSVDASGLVSGTPAARGTSRVTVEATASDGATARLDVTIPVRGADEARVDHLGVMTFNLWHGGTQVRDYHRKQVAFIAGSGVDVVGLQESTGGHAIRLATALGWEFWQSRDVGIISRYPIVEVFTEAQAAGGVRVELDARGGKQAVVWNAHLGYNPYGPYDFCFDGMSNERVMQREAESGRTPQIYDLVERMRGHLADAGRVPVILTGDFNAPSHLDWTDATRDQHCGVGQTQWPTSVEPVAAGLADSFREAHPDPAAVPGITWSPVFLDNNGRREPLDRIDFIYHRGLRTLDSQLQVVGSPTPQPNHQDNEWTSDHAAVKTVFALD